MNSVSASKPALVSRKFRLIPVYVFLILWSVIMGFPLFWMITTAFKPNPQIVAYPPQWWPKPWILDHFVDALQEFRFFLFFRNSVMVSVTATAINLFLNSLTGYVFARMRFPGRELLFWLVMGSIVVPGQVRMIPTFLLLRYFPLAGGNNVLGQGGIGLLNTLIGIILPGLAGGFGIFMMRQFMSTIPRDLEDAARIDGCSEFGIYWRIIVPLSKPALLALGLLVFTNNWNDFLWPLVVVNSERLKTIQLGLAGLRGLFYVDYGVMMAAATLATAPVIIAFFVGQRYFVEGLTMSGLKG